MFTNVERYAGDNQYDELNLFYTNDPVNGVWEPHAGNPVKTDVRSARMAGGFLRKDGALYRCAQESEVTYGSALIIAEVLDLTPTIYKERICATIRPKWNPFLFGLHHISVRNGWTAFDAIARSSWLEQVRYALERGFSRFLPGTPDRKANMNFHSAKDVDNHSTKISCGRR